MMEHDVKPDDVTTATRRAMRPDAWEINPLSVRKTQLINCKSYPEERVCLTLFSLDRGLVPIGCVINELCC